MLCAKLTFLHLAIDLPEYSGSESSSGEESEIDQENSPPEAEDEQYYTPKEPRKKRSKSSKNSKSSKKKGKTKHQAPKKTAKTRKIVEISPNQDPQEPLSSDDEDSMGGTKRKTNTSKRAEARADDAPNSDEKDQRIAQLEEENAQLRNNSGQAAAKKSRAMTKKDRDSEARTEVLTAINLWIRENGWRTVKFITSERQQDRVTEQFYDSLADNQGNLPKDTEPKPLFMSLYGPYVCELLNKHRSYVMGQMKKKCFQFMDEHNGQMPTLASIQKIVCRKLDPQAMKDEDWEVSTWYWDDLLPAAAATKYLWQDYTRWYATISEAAHPDFPNKLQIPPSTEAILCIFYENCAERWANQWKFKKDFPKLRIDIRKRYREFVFLL